MNIEDTIRREQFRKIKSGIRARAGEPEILPVNSISKRIQQPPRDHTVLFFP